MEAMMARTGRPCERLSYERDILDNDMATLGHLGAILQKPGLDIRISSDIYWKPPIKRGLAILAETFGQQSPWAPELGYTRQDMNHTPENKVANWTNFAADLDKRGELWRLNNYG